MNPGCDQVNKKHRAGQGLATTLADEVALQYSEMTHLCVALIAQ